MTTLVDFAPSATSLFTFLAQFASGGQYNVTTPYNNFRQGYFVSVLDLSNTVLLYRSLVQSGPSINASLMWNQNVATAVLTGPHNIPIGSVANARVSGTDTGFDGTYQMLATDSMTLTYSLTANPGASGVTTGQVDFPLDLLAGYDIGPLYFHSDTQQFEY